MTRNTLFYVAVAVLAGGALATGRLLQQQTAAGVPTPTVAPAPIRPSASFPPGGCAYTWAYRDVPELTQTLQAGVQRLEPKAQARAEAFGEECVASDGRSTFGALETDFYVMIPDADLSDEEAMGDWIASVFGILADFTEAETPGSQLGFVEFRFTHSEDEFRLVRVSIAAYQTHAQGKAGAALFRFFAEVR